MEKFVFSKIVENPFDLSEKELENVEELVNTYPYFQIAHILRLQNHYGDDKYERLLQKSGIYIPDIRHYYRNLMLNKMYVSKDSEPKAETAILDIEKDKTEKEQIVEEKTDNQEIANKKTRNETILPDKLEYAPTIYKIEEKKTVSPPNLEKETLGFTDWLGTLENSQKSEKTIEKKDEKAIKTTATIDDFIRKEKKNIEKIKAEVKGKNEEKQPSKEQLMSQTLAEIYVKQQLYDRAISIYQKLDLNSSEKNTIFATRIKEINELKNN